MTNRKALWLATLLLAPVLAGCAAGPYRQAMQASERGDHDRAVALLYEEIQRHPSSGAAWRELGVAFYRRGESGKAVEALNQANRIAPDARAHLFLGIIQEAAGDLEAAASLYQHALALQPSRQTTRLLRAHLHDLERERIAAEARQALARERELDVAALPENAVAVHAFDGSGLPADYAPLARGFAELTALDLAKVSALRVVERARVQALLKELSLDTLGVVDPTTAPRVGRLVGGRRIVTGTLTGLPDGRFQIGGALVDARDGSLVTAQPAAGALDDFFDVQKSFVMELVGELGAALGFELSREERDAIQAHPTEDLLALLAFSRGLSDLDAGRLDAAQSEFSRAVTLDPGFGAAAARAAMTTDLLAVYREYGAADFSGFAAAADAQSQAPAAFTDGDLAGVQSALIAGQGFIPPDGTNWGLYDNAPGNPTVYLADDVARITARGNLDR